jgi:hypothetical protein
MSVGSRITVAALATVLALPFGAGACVFLLDRGIGDDSVHASQVPTPLVLGAILVLGVLAVYEIGSRITRGRIDGRAFSMFYVAMCAVCGMVGGLLLVTAEPISGALGLAFLGAFMATFVRQRGSGRDTRSG